MIDTLVISSALLWAVVLLNLLLTLALIRRLNTTATQDNQRRMQGGLPVNEPAPNFAAETVDGQPVSLATYSGRTVALMFVSPSCEPCRALVPKVEAITSVATQAGVEIVFVSLADRASTVNLIDDLQITLPTLVAGATQSKFAAAFKVHGTPAFCLLDASGRVLANGYPSFEWGDWRRLVDAWQIASNRSTSGQLASA